MLIVTLRTTMNQIQGINDKNYEATNRKTGLGNTNTNITNE